MMYLLTKGYTMKPTINYNWSEKALELIELVGLREAAYQCGVAEYTMKRISNGSTVKVDYDCGVLMLWLLELHS